MSNIYESESLKKEAEALLTLDDKQLEELLEMRVSAINQEPSLVLQPTFDVIGDNYEALPIWITKTVNTMKATALRQTFNIFCSDEPDYQDTRNKLINALGLGGTTLVLALAGVLTTTLGLAAALATVLATIVIKKIGEPTIKAGGKALCEEFEKSLSA